MSILCSRWVDTIVLLGSLLVGMPFGWSALGAQADHALYDFILRINPPPPERSRSLILAFDDDTLAAHGGLRNLREPLARALDIIAEHGPAAVAIDLVLAEPGEEGANRQLARAIASAGNVVLATHLTGTEEVSWLDALPDLRDNAASLAHVHAYPDEDGVSRRLALAKAAGLVRRWAMALETLRLTQGNATVIETQDGLQVGDLFIPAAYSEGRSILIRYANPSQPIERLSLGSVLADPARAAIVRDRVVFVGVVVAGGLDQFLMTPYSYGQAMTGVEINANAFETLAGGSFLQTVSPSAVLLIGICGALVFVLIFRFLSGRTALVVAAVCLVAIHALPFVLFRADWVLPFAPIAAVTWLSSLASGGRLYLRLRGHLEQAEAERTRYQRAVHYVTHEMRTPLTTIQGSSELISRYELNDEKRKEIADRIHSESVRLGRMVEMFLSVERLAAGQIDLRPKSIAIDEVLNDAVERIRPLADRKDIEIQLIGQAGFIHGDAEFLEYACYNLLTNAVKYSPAHSTITVRTESDSQSVRITVTDKGYGMDEVDLKNIFHRFYRTRQARESGENGTGLGLALVEEIVIQHGGSIEVESRIDEGSQFTITLPRAAQAAMEVER